MPVPNPSPADVEHAKVFLRALRRGDARAWRDFHEIILHRKTDARLATALAVYASHGPNLVGIHD